MSHEQGGDKSREPLTPRVVEQMRAAGKAGYLDTGSAAWDMLCDLALSALRSSVAGSEAAAQAYKDFWDKHAKGSMLCPSCLMCGAACAKEQWAIRHAELPDIYICACCVEKVRNPIETGVSARRGNYWLLNFDDRDKPDEIFTDEAAARARYEQAVVNWNCHLFVEVEGVAEKLSSYVPEGSNG